MRTTKTIGIFLGSVVVALMVLSIMVASPAMACAIQESIHHHDPVTGDTWILICLG